MNYITLGKTGLKVSRMGLGCGGHSRLGMARGGSQADAEAVVRAALDLGVNFIDTAEGYGTEEAVGSAIKGAQRSELVISTKVGVSRNERRCTSVEYTERADACLKRLQTDYVDIFHIHGLSAKDYSYAVEELLPALEKMRAAGKVRFIGVTEGFGQDPGHGMLEPAVKHGPWDGVMVGFSLLNQSARERVLTHTQRRGIGTLCMFAVRRALSNPDALKELMADLAGRGLVAASTYNPDDPLDFLLEETDSVADAAYRYCVHEPGLEVILSGTGSIEHLRANAASLQGPPLSPTAAARLNSLFARVDCVSGN